MNGRCETDPFDQAVDVCDSCYGEFCGNCLVEQRGRRHPLCKECVIVASGLRSGAKVVKRGEKKTAKSRRKELANTVDKGRDFQFFDEEVGGDPMLSPPPPLPSMEPAMPPIFDGPDPIALHELPPPSPTDATPPPPTAEPSVPADSFVSFESFDAPFDGSAYDPPVAPANPAVAGPGSDATSDTPTGHGSHGAAPDALLGFGTNNEFGTGEPRFEPTTPTAAEEPPVPDATIEPVVGFGGGPTSAISQLSQLRNDDQPDKQAPDPVHNGASALDGLGSQIPDLSRSPFEQNTAPTDLSRSPFEQNTAPTDRNNAPTEADTAPSDRDTGPSDRESEPSDGEGSPKLPPPRLHAPRPSTVSEGDGAGKPSGRGGRSARGDSNPARSRPKPSSAGGSARRAPKQVRPPGHPGATRRPAPDGQESPNGTKPKRRGVAAPGAPVSRPGRAKRKPSEVPPALRGPMPDDPADGETHDG